MLFMRLKKRENKNQVMVKGTNMVRGLLQGMYDINLMMYPNLNLNVKNKKIKAHSRDCSVVASC